MITKQDFDRIKPLLHLPEAIAALKTNDFDRFFQVILTSGKARKFDIADIFMFFAEDLHINPLEHMTAIPKMFFSKIPVEEIEIPSNIRVIEEGAFMGNQYLEKVEFSELFPEDTIPQNCFRDCWNLKEVYLGKNTDFLDRGSFTGCDDVTIFASCEGDCDCIEDEEDFFKDKIKKVR